jgi:hypothetical protein
VDTSAKVRSFGPVKRPVVEVAEPEPDPFDAFDQVVQRFGRPVANSGLVKRRFHCSLAAGVDLALVSKLLGHWSISLGSDT